MFITLEMCDNHVQDSGNRFSKKCDMGVVTGVDEGEI
jgi:hypothetical protein